MNSMNMKKKLWLGLAAFALIAIARPAHAGNPESLDITVTISATKSLALGATFYDFGAQNVNVSTVSTSAISVTNDSTGLIETYTIQGANAISVGGTNWTLAGAPGNDTYSLAAQFATAQPNNLDAAWTNDDLTTSAIVCDNSTGTLGNGTLAQSGQSVAPTGVRSLWFRMKTPTVVSDVSQRKATLTLAVQ